jgi:hypothetical protein
MNPQNYKIAGVVSVYYYLHYRSGTKKAIKKGMKEEERRNAAPATRATFSVSAKLMLG